MTKDKNLIAGGRFVGASKKLNYILDLDGTVYRGMSRIPHAKEFIQYLYENNRRFLIVTNCPGSSPAGLVLKLGNMGISVNEDNILTSGQAAASFLVKTGEDQRIYLIGSKALEADLLGKGLQIVSENPDCVIVGYDKEFNYDKMKNAVKWILGGAKFIATNGDCTIPDGNEIVPHTGAITSSIEAATGIKPLIIGKPQEYILNEALDRMACGKEECCIIGDRLDTDILTGVKHGILSCLVLTGVTGASQLEKSDIRPTKVFKDLKELMEWDETLSE